MTRKQTLRTYPAHKVSPYGTRLSEDYYIRVYPPAVAILPLLNGRGLSILSYILRHMNHYNGFIILRRDDVLTQYANLAGDSYYAGLQNLLDNNVISRASIKHNVFYVNTMYFKRINKTQSWQ